MDEYRIELVVNVDLNYIVEAESEEDAIEQAKDQAEFDIGSDNIDINHIGKVEYGD